MDMEGYRQSFPQFVFFFFFFFFYTYTNQPLFTIALRESESLVIFWDYFYFSHLSSFLPLSFFFFDLSHISF